MVRKGKKKSNLKANVPFKPETWDANINITCFFCRKQESFPMNPLVLARNQGKQIYEWSTWKLQGFNHPK